MIKRILIISVSVICVLVAIYVSRQIDSVKLLEADSSTTNIVCYVGDYIPINVTETSGLTYDVSSNMELANYEYFTLNKGLLKALKVGNGTLKLNKGKSVVTINYNIKAKVEDKLQGIVVTSDGTRGSDILVMLDSKTFCITDSNGFFSLPISNKVFKSLSIGKPKDKSVIGYRLLDVGIVRDKLIIKNKQNCDYNDGILTINAKFDELMLK